MDHLKYGLLQHILITNKINNFMQIDLLVPLKINTYLIKLNDKVLMRKIITSRCQASLKTLEVYLLFFFFFKDIS